MTGKYTTIGGKADQQIEKYVDIVVEEVKNSIPDTKSILLAGGFGRAEGSVALQNNQICPINDMDVYVITEGKEYSEDFVNTLGQNAAKKIGKAGIQSFVKFDKYNIKPLSEFFYIDLKTIPYQKLKKMPPMIRYYEIKNRAMPIYGEDARKYLPDYTPKDLPLAEGLRLLMNRMSHLVEYFYPEFLTGKVEDKYHQVFLMHAIKSYLASCGALLLLSKKFAPTYLERAKILEETYEQDFPDLHSKLPDLPEKVREFTDLKVNFNFDAWKGKDFELWKQSRHYVGEVSKYFVSKYVGKPITNWQQLSDALYSKVGKTYYNQYISNQLRNKHVPLNNQFLLSRIATPARIYLNYIYHKRIKEYHNTSKPSTLFRLSSPDLTVFSSLPLILFSMDDNGNVDEKMLAKGRKQLARAFPVSASEKKWEEVAKAYSNAYVLFAFLKII